MYLEIKTYRYLEIIHSSGKNSQVKEQLTNETIGKGKNIVRTICKTGVESINVHQGKKGDLRRMIQASACKR